MMRFLRAHGMDSGPLQRPILAGLASGLAAAVPAAGVLAAFGTFQVTADEVMRVSRVLAAIVFASAFAAGGALYGLALGRAANDARGGWLFGMVFGFGLWLAAPVLVLPLVADGTMAAGRPAMGFLAAFLAWGLVTGAIFPFAHRPLKGSLSSNGRAKGSAAVEPRRILRRGPRH